MAPLGKQRQVLRIYEGIEISGIKEEGLQINLEMFDQSGGEIFFDLEDRILIEATHVIPETLA